MREQFCLAHSINVNFVIRILDNSRELPIIHTCSLLRSVIAGCVLVRRYAHYKPVVVRCPFQISITDCLFAGKSAHELVEVSRPLYYGNYADRRLEGWRRMLARHPSLHQSGFHHSDRSLRGSGRVPSRIWRYRVALWFHIALLKVSLLLVMPVSYDLLLKRQELVSYL